jgi:hypothetical protein
MPGALAADASRSTPTGASIYRKIEQNPLFGRLKPLFGQSIVAVRCPSQIPLESAFRTSATAPAAREPGTRVTIHDSNARPPSRPTRAPGPPDSDVALNTDDLATADTDRAPAASRTVRPVMVEIFGLRPALRRNRSPTNHKDPFPLISLLPLLRREQLCLRRVR